VYKQVCMFVCPSQIHTSIFRFERQRAEASGVDKQMTPLNIFLAQQPAMPRSLLEKPSAAASGGSGAAGPDYDNTNRQCATGKCNMKKNDTVRQLLVVWLKDGSDLLASAQALWACTSCIGTTQRSTKYRQCSNDFKLFRRFAR
jgi:hypothetical protein